MEAKDLCKDKCNYLVYQHQFSITGFYFTIVPQRSSVSVKVSMIYSYHSNKVQNLDIGALLMSKIIFLL